MKKLTLIGVIVMIIGLTGAMVLNYPATDILSLVTTFAGAGMVLYSMLDKKDNRTWKDYLFLSLIAVGTVIFVFGGFSKDNIVTIVGALITVISAILSLFLKSKAEAKMEVTEKN